MKNLKLFIPVLLIAIYFTSFTSCSKTDDLNLDSALFGKWLITDSDGTKWGWVFNDDGSCIQTVYTGDYDWQWKIEDSKLKLYVDGGTPRFIKYKIEGNKLYFWSDSLEIWGVPFIKQ